MSTRWLFFIMMVLFVPTAFSDGQDEVSQVARITGVSPSRVAKIKESSDKGVFAFDLVRKKQFDQAYAVLKTIAYENGFRKVDVEGAIYQIALSYKIAGDYQRSYETLQNLSNLGWSNSTLENHFRELKAIMDFQTSSDKKPVLDFVEWFKSQNKPFFPPKGFELDRLARVIRPLEMANEIDRALELVEQYHAVYFPKKGFKKEPSSIVKRRQEGLKLLKEALLRDKQEGKNIYAQELINTTDYFGFV